MVSFSTIKRITLFTALFAQVLFGRPLSAAQQTTFLKINQFYVIYTNPLVPYFDKSGTFIVGLNAISLILGSKVKKVTASQSEVVTMARHTVRFVAGSTTAFEDGKPVHLLLAVRYDKQTQQMIVPLSALIKAFHISSHWDPKHRVLTLMGRNFFGNVDPEVISSMYSQNPGPRSNLLVPVDLGIHVSPVNAHYHFLRFRVKNASSQILPSNSVFLDTFSASEEYSPHPLGSQEVELNLNHVRYDSGVVTAPDIAYPNPAVRPGEIIQIGPSLPQKIYPSVLYVAVWPFVSGHRYVKRASNTNVR